jgi:hypothetical protein
MGGGNTLHMQDNRGRTADTDVVRMRHFIQIATNIKAPTLRRLGMQAKHASAGLLRKRLNSERPESSSYPAREFLQLLVCGEIRCERGKIWEIWGRVECCEAGRIGRVTLDGNTVLLGHIARVYVRERESYHVVARPADRDRQAERALVK